MRNLEETDCSRNSVAVQGVLGVDGKLRGETGMTEERLGKRELALAGQRTWSKMLRGTRLR